MRALAERSGTFTCVRYRPGFALLDPLPQRQFFRSSSRIRLLLMLT